MMPALQTAFNMRMSPVFRPELVAAPIVLTMMLGFARFSRAQEGKPDSTQNENTSGGMPFDWSHHHVNFSPPGTAEEALKNGTYDRWLAITSDPRYELQQRRRGGAGPARPFAPPPTLNEDDDRGCSGSPEGEEERALPEKLPHGLINALIPPPPDARKEPSENRDCRGGSATNNRFKHDWSEDFGNNGSTGLGNYPATFTSTSTSCTADFAIYNTGLAGSSSQPTIVAFNKLYSDCASGPSVDWAYNTGAAVTTSIALSLDGTQVAMIGGVPYPVVASGEAIANTGVVPATNSTITVAGTTYTWKTTTNITTVNQMSTHGITLESEIAQTLYAALTGSRANCPSSNTTCIASTQTANSSVSIEVVGETLVLTAACGVGTCGNTVVFSQSGTTGMTLSPSTGTLSGGSGTAGVGGATLVLLKPSTGGSITSPATPNLVSNSSYRTCAVPCMTTLQLSGALISTTTGPSDTYSSPFYDFGDDILYVGDDSGGLHKFTGVFYGTPAETTTSGWPIAVNSTASLASPVYDSVSGNIFVGDYLESPASACEPGVVTIEGACGYLYYVNATGTPGVVKSQQLDYNKGIYDGPLVDSSAGQVYAFIGSDGSTSCTGNPCAAVYQLPTNFTSSTTPVEATIGAGYEFVMSGAFDNQYFTSANPSSPTGNLYVVGGTGAQNNTLYAVPILNNMMGSAKAGPVVATNYTDSLYGAGLPVTEFCNNGSNPCTAMQGTDYIFLGVLAYGSSFATNPCAGQSATVGCIMGFTAPTSGMISNAATPNGTLAEAGGVSGIVIDNGASGASNIYFSTLSNQSCAGGTGGCAVSATQSGLN